MPVNAKISLRGDKYGNWLLDIELENGENKAVVIGPSAAEKLEMAGVPDESPDKPKDNNSTK